MEKLVIELDGNPQGEYHKIEKDNKRDQYLEGLGFSIMDRDKMIYRSGLSIQFSSFTP